MIGCLSYGPGTKHTTQTFALTGNRTADLLLCGMMPNPLSHMGQGRPIPDGLFEVAGRVGGVSSPQWNKGVLERPFL